MQACWKITIFAADPEAARVHIHGWVASETHDKIKDLIPAGEVTPNTFMVLTNAVYLKLKWQSPFEPDKTREQPWLGRDAHAVPICVQLMAKMWQGFGYTKGEGWQAVRLPYKDNQLHLLVVVPDAVDGLPAVEQHLSAARIAALADRQSGTPTIENAVHLFLPKFKIAAATLPLTDALKRLGMHMAFDEPAKAADF